MSFSFNAQGDLIVENIKNVGQFQKQYKYWIDLNKTDKLDSVANNTCIINRANVVEFLKEGQQKSPAEILKIFNEAEGSNESLKTAPVFQYLKKRLGSTNETVKLSALNYIPHFVDIEPLLDNIKRQFSIGPTHKAYDKLKLNENEFIVAQIHSSELAKWNNLTLGGAIPFSVTTKGKKGKNSTEYYFYDNGTGYCVKAIYSRSQKRYVPKYEHTWINADDVRKNILKGKKCRRAEIELSQQRTQISRKLIEARVDFFSGNLEQAEKKLTRQPDEQDTLKYLIRKSSSFTNQCTIDYLAADGKVAHIRCAWDEEEINTKLQELKLSWHESNVSNNSSHISQTEKKQGHLADYLAASNQSDCIAAYLNALFMPNNRKMHKLDQCYWVVNQQGVALYWPYKQGAYISLAELAGPSSYLENKDIEPLYENNTTLYNKLNELGCLKMNSLYYKDTVKSGGVRYDYAFNEGGHKKLLAQAKAYFSRQNNSPHVAQMESLKEAISNLSVLYGEKIEPHITYDEKGNSFKITLASTNQELKDYIKLLGGKYLFTAQVKSAIENMQEYIANDTKSEPSITLNEIALVLLSIQKVTQLKSSFSYKVSVNGEEKTLEGVASSLFHLKPEALKSLFTALINELNAGASTKKFLNGANASSVYISLSPTVPEGKDSKGNEIEITIPNTCDLLHRVTRRINEKRNDKKNELFFDSKQSPFIRLKGFPEKLKNSLSDTSVLSVDGKINIFEASNNAPHTAPTRGYYTIANTHGFNDKPTALVDFDGGNIAAREAIFVDKMSANKLIGNFKPASDIGKKTNLGKKTNFDREEIATNLVSDLGSLLNHVRDTFTCHGTNEVLKIVQKNKTNMPINLNSTALDCVPLSAFVEANTGLCRHASLLTAVLAGHLANQVYGGQVYIYRSQGQDDEGHSAVIYVKNDKTYLIDSLFEKVFDLNNENDLKDAILNYQKKGLGGFLDEFSDTNNKQKKIDLTYGQEKEAERLGLVCPITLEVMREPVKIIFENDKKPVPEYYEKEAIEAHIKQNNSDSPLSRRPITQKLFKVDEEKKKQINAFLQECESQNLKPENKTTSSVSGVQNAFEVKGNNVVLPQRKKTTGHGMKKEEEPKPAIHGHTREEKMKLQKVEINLQKILEDAGKPETKLKDICLGLEVNLLILRAFKLPESVPESLKSELEAIKKYKTELEAKIVLLQLEVKLAGLREKLYKKSNKDFQFFHQKHSRQELAKRKFESYQGLSTELVGLQKDVGSKEPTFSKAFEGAEEQFETLQAGIASAIKACTILRESYKEDKATLVKKLEHNDALNKDNFEKLCNLVTNLLSNSHYKKLKDRIEGINPKGNQQKENKKKQFKALNDKLTDLQRELINPQKNANEYLKELSKLLNSCGNYSDIIANTGSNFRTPPTEKYFLAFQKVANELINDIKPNLQTVNEEKIGFAPLLN